MMDDGGDGMQDICRVCRSEASPDRPLFYPCVCTGSIKYIHQDCLTQWLRYSRKEYCELCNHRFSFTPIYAPDMPKRLPIKDVVLGLVTSVGTAVRYWFHYTLVAFAWLGVVPLSACRIHRSLFTGSVTSILALPIDLLSTENIVVDIFHGCVVVLVTLSIFLSLIWLREHIMHGGGPEWLVDPPAEENNEAADPVVGDEEVLGENEEGGQEERRGGLFFPEGAPPPRPNNNNNNNHRAGRGGGGANDELNWPMDWGERAGEELTWEKLLGLDGSLLFVEYVFWVVSLNTLCILIFEFSPYHIGYFTLSAFQAQDWIQYAHFEGLLTTLTGYFIIGISLVLLHSVASLCGLRKSRKFLGISYVVVKVCLLAVAEVGIFPLLCGWWIDICSLPLFDATLKDREASFVKAPGTSMFMHWLFGMVYVFYFASFILLLREVLRPGVLWFLRNLNDPDFNPVQEMIHLPILKHIRRFLFSGIIFGTTTLLIFWVPIQIVKKFWPTFLPYNFVYTTEATHELSLELVLLQVMMPALLEQGHSREWMKSLIRFWCICASWILDIRSYLLGDVDIVTEGQNETPPAAPVPEGDGELAHENENENEEEDEEEEEVENENENDNDWANEGVVLNRGGGGGGNVVNEVLHEEVNDVINEEVPLVEEGGGAPGGLGFVLGAGLGAAHQALLQRDSPRESHPYIRPHLFHFKIGVLFMAICMTLSVVSLGILTLPVLIGRTVMNYWLQSKGEGIHELYTTATGLYVTWVAIRCLILLATWIPKGWAVFLNTVKAWSLTVTKTAVAMIILVGFIPYLCGLLVELVVITPLRIPINQSPIHIASENWVMGTLYIKIACASTMMFPQNFWLRRTLERIYNNGIRNINLNFIIKELAAPCIAAFGLALAIPYVISRSIVPLMVTNLETQNLFERRIFPFILILGLIYGIILFQIRQFTKLYEHIKNDKYLVGRRLVNYERPPPTPAIQSTPTPTQ